MNRPLIISDCDEVLLHMVAPFRDWLAEAHDVDFDMAHSDFASALSRRSDGAVVEGPEIWRLLNLFFDTEMHRQRPIAGAVDALAELSRHADVVVLTNLSGHRQDARAAQLSAAGLDVRVFTNQGLKGPALRAILDEYAPSRALFIDDLPQHHGSAAELVPQVTRLHLCGEPLLAPHIACAHAAGHAHARIDDWASALPWIRARLNLETVDA